MADGGRTPLGLNIPTPKLVSFSSPRPIANFVNGYVLYMLMNNKMVDQIVVTHPNYQQVGLH